MFTLLIFIMTKKITYTLTAPLRSSFVFSIEAEEGLDRDEICNLVSRDDLANASPQIDWGDLKSSWEEDWNAATHIKGNVHPWDATYIEDESGNEIEKESSK